MNATASLSRCVACGALLASTALTSAAMAQALTCDSLRAQIESKIRAAGAVEFALAIVDTNAEAPGRVVGTCDLGTKKVVYVPGKTASTPAGAVAKEQPRPAKQTARAKEPILTECKDGRILLGGDCR